MTPINDDQYDSDVEDVDVIICSAQTEYEDLKQENESLENGVEKWEQLHELAEMAYGISNDSVNTGRVEWLVKAHEHAKLAHESAPYRMDFVKTLCSVTGRLAEESNFWQKINYGFEFQKYLDVAIALDDESDDISTFELRHMRGRFILAVASLGLVERTLARAIGALPTVDLDQAITDLEKADTICSTSAENQLYCGKCYLAKGDQEKATYWLTKAAAQETDTVIEEEHVTEAKILLRQQ